MFAVGGGSFAAPRPRTRSRPLHETSDEDAAAICVAMKEVRQAGRTHPDVNHLEGDIWHSRLMVRVSPIDYCSPKKVGPVRSFSHSRSSIRQTTLVRTPICLVGASISSRRTEALKDSERLLEASDPARVRELIQRKNGSNRNAGRASVRRFEL